MGFGSNKVEEKREERENVWKFRRKTKRNQEITRKILEKQKKIIKNSLKNLNKEQKNVEKWKKSEIMRKTL